MAWLFGLFSVLPNLSPKGFDISSFLGVYTLISRATLVFFLYLTCVVTFVGLGHGAVLDMTTRTVAGVGCLLAVLGNYLGKVRKNYFVGIRTPWTLANDEVWVRTHRLGARLFLLGGLLIVVGALLGKGIYVLLPTVLATTLVTTAYSYLVYRRFELPPR